MVRESRRRQTNLQLSLSLPFGEVQPEFKAKIPPGKMGTPKRGQSVNMESARLIAEETLCHVRDIAASKPAENRLAFARGFVFEVISAYWQEWQSHDGPAKPLLEPPSHVGIASIPGTIRESARAVGTAAADLDTMAASYMIGVLYTATMPDRFRMKLGCLLHPARAVRAVA